MSVRVVQKNPNWKKELIRRYKDAAKKEIAVGWPVGTDSVGLQYPDGTPVLLVAFWNQFGTKTSPRRDFLGPGGLRATEATKEMREVTVKQINAGKDPDKLFKQIGSVAVAEVQGAITDLSEPPNAPFTIAQKAHLIP